MLDDVDLYIESAIFYQDEVENGRGAQYRICSLDIFGRTSEYSEVLIINEGSTQKVEKVTPPNAPSLSAPALSSDTISEKIAAVQASIDQNADKKGVVLPIFTESSDTARFTIYRAVAVGAGGFGEPEILANIMYDNPLPKDTGVYTEEAGGGGKAPNDTSHTLNIRSDYKVTTLPSHSYELSNGKRTQQMLLTNNTPLEPSLVFFDADIQEGCTYKYWVSAWDEPQWNNESAWSSPVTIGVSTEAQPKIPGALDITMLVKELPELSDLPPGIVLDAKITKELLAQPMLQSLQPRKSGAGVDNKTVDAAEKNGVNIGRFISGASEAALAPEISLAYDNLPEDRYIHMFVAVRGEDIQPDGNAYLRWPAYSGGGLNGYVIYKPEFTGETKTLNEMQTMTRNELVGMCAWHKVSDAITQNQVLVSGLDSTPGSLNLFLVCLEPEHNFESSQYISDSNVIQTGSDVLTEPIKPATPKKPTLSSLSDITVEVPPSGIITWTRYEKGSIKISFAGRVTIEMSSGQIWTYETGRIWNTSYDKYYLDCLQAAYERMQTWTYHVVWPYLETYYNAYQSAYLAYEAALANYPAALEAYEADLAAYEEAVYLELISGFVKIEWDAPDDPQIKYYRVYRSEVTKADFQNPVNTDGLEWTMVGDRVTAAQFTDPVEQSIAHYYYYKVTAVTAWGVESTVKKGEIESPAGAEQSFRVPATIPPATPNMQMPLSGKNGVKVNFSAVNNCDRYVVYRTEITRLTQAQIDALKAGNENIFGALFQPVSKKDEFMSNMLVNSLSRFSSFIVPQSTNGLSSGASYTLLSAAQPGLLASPVAAQFSEINALNKFKTVSQISRSSLRQSLSTVNNESQLRFVQTLVDSYGPLVVADYCDLSFEMMQKVVWEEVGTLTVAEDVWESSDGNNMGLLKPLFIEDTKAQYGHRYLYTVRAWNDDDLGSAAPEPVEGATRRDGAFDPIDGIEGKIETIRITGMFGQSADADCPRITWNPPHMDRAELTVEECIEDTVGYIVYRADKKEGSYYQASPLLFNTEWVDMEADIHANNWYNVKVLDTGGYLSDFGTPVNVTRSYVTSLRPFIPPDLTIPMPPVVNIPGGPYTVRQGDILVVPFTVTGDEPITYTIEGSASGGAAITGLTVDGGAKTITIPATLAAGSYSATLTAKNNTGTGQASLSFTVETSSTAPKIDFSGSRFSTQQGTAFQAPYTLTGTEPITVTVAATNERGVAVFSFWDLYDSRTDTRMIETNDSLAAGTYTVKVTATNTAGESSATFTLYVTDPAPVLPSVSIDSAIAERGGADIVMPFFVTGTEPIAYELHQLFRDTLWMTPRDEFSIDTVTNAIVCNAGIPAGVYDLRITSTNAAGSSYVTVTLEVTEPARPIRPTNSQEIQPDLPGLTQLSFASNNSGMEITRLAAVQTPLSQTDSYQKSTVWCGQFTLKDVNASRPAVYIAGTTPPGYSGTAMLDIGCDELIPVMLVNASFQDRNGAVGEMLSGTVYLQDPYKIEKTGVTLASLEFSPDKNTTATVSGYMESVTAGQNLVGNVGVLEFTDATLILGSIHISNNIPNIRCEQYTFRPGGLTIGLSAAWSEYTELGNSGFIEMNGGRVLLKSHLETLDNKDIEFIVKSNIVFDLQGKIIAGNIETKEEQALQLLVPGGSMLRIEQASLSFKDGKADDSGSLRGRLILPFENPDLFSKGLEVPGEYAKPVHPDKNFLDAMLFTGVYEALGFSEAEINELYASIIHFGETVQKNGLLIVPRDKELQDLCSYAEINLPSGWDGAGFVVQNAKITPVNMAERSLPVNDSDGASQRKQGIEIKATTWGVYVDLDRNRSWQSVNGAPNETKEDFWVGIIYGGGFLSSTGKTSGGTVKLPPGYVKTKSGDAIVFDLEPGEMIYDLNGFNYQTYLYAPGPEGVEAQTGEELGGFTSAWVHKVMVDMYNNKVDLEIEMTVAVDFLMGNSVKAKLYTVKEPEEGPNGVVQPGTFLCSVAPTIIHHAIAPWFDLRIDGGWFVPDGMRISGALLLPDPEIGFDVKPADPLEFTDLVIPAVRGKTAFGSEKYGYAALDKPAQVDFNGYTVEVRVLNMESFGTQNGITLLGATVLSDNIPLSTENTDQIVMLCGRPESVLSSPVEPNNLYVNYEASKSVLNNTFDECFTVSGILTPKTPQSGGAVSQSRSGYTGSGVSNLLYTEPSGEGRQYMTLAGGSAQNKGRFTEYETADIAFGFIDALELIPFKTAVRFGYDNELGRNYFAIGLTYSGMPVEFGFGQIRDVGGVVSYNMNVDRDPTQHNRFKFPDSPDKVKPYIAGLTPYEGSGTKFAAGFYATMNVEHICEIRGMYFAFESGPIIEAGGDFYVPLDPTAIFKDSHDFYTKVGSCIIMYNHPARNFSLNVDLDYRVVGIEVYGSISMQWNPTLFGIYIGYPEMLTAKVPGFKAGAGFAFQAGKEDSFIAAKMMLGWSYDADIGIIYIGGYIEGGVGGEYHFAGENKGNLELELWLKGGIKGGIWFFGRRDIINFYLGAEGKLLRTASSNEWRLAASCEVGYSVSLFVASISGSAHVSFNTTF
jgi:PKD repeat protein